MPRRIEKLKEKFVTQVEAGDASSACITHDLNVYMWGSGLNGRLGNGTKHNLTTPDMSQELKKKQVISITKGTNSTFAIFESKKVCSWGSSKNGKLGFELPQGKNYELPREIISFSHDKHEIYQIAAGPFHTVCLTTRGKILVMGNSKDGKLGIKPAGEGSVVDIELPTHVEAFVRGRLEKVIFFCKDQLDTEIRQFPLFDDYNEYGRLKAQIKKNVPYECVSIKCGFNFELFLMNNGDVYSCGANKYG